MKNMKTIVNKIVIPCCNTYEIVPIDNIVRCEALQNYCRFYIENGNTLTSTNTLGYYKKKLEMHGFISCHRSHLVNQFHITKYHKEGSVELSDQSSVPVSRRMRSSFLNHITENFIY